MDRIDDLWLKSVFYIYASEEDARDKTITDSATGFVVAVASEYDRSQSYLYAVTNWHVLLKTLYKPVLRINTINGGYEIRKTEEMDWKVSSKRCDVAISLISLDESVHDVSPIPTGYFLDKEFIKKHNVGVGDEVVMIGNFQTRGGNKRNIPTVRFGNISQMPDEPMRNLSTGFDETSFIVEMRSASGYSGSPVIVTIHGISNRRIPDDERKGLKPVWHNLEPDYYRLLGIDWGHIQTKEFLYDNDGNILPDRKSVRINSAMAGVVPAWELAEMIFSDEEIRARNGYDEELKKKASQVS